MCGAIWEHLGEHVENLGAHVENLIGKIMEEHQNHPSIGEWKISKYTRKHVLGLFTNPYYFHLCWVLVYWNWKVQLWTFGPQLESELEQGQGFLNQTRLISPINPEPVWNKLGPVL
jgi:hypothetical protein